MENILIAIYFSLFAITYVVKSELNINTVYEKFIPRGGDTALFGASLGKEKGWDINLAICQTCASFPKFLSFKGQS